jgi:hypothetical protein
MTPNSNSWGTLLQLSKWLERDNWSSPTIKLWTSVAISPSLHIYHLWLSSAHTSGIDTSVGNTSWKHWWGFINDLQLIKHCLAVDNGFPWSDEAKDHKEKIDSSDDDLLLKLSWSIPQNVDAHELLGKEGKIIVAIMTIQPHLHMILQNIHLRGNPLANVQLFAVLWGLLFRSLLFADNITQLYTTCHWISVAHSFGWQKCAKQCTDQLLLVTMFSSRVL